MCGDNFVIKGMRHRLYEFCINFSLTSSQRTELLDQAPSHSDASGILIRWSVPPANRRDAIEIEEDQRHSDFDLNQLNLEKNQHTRGVTQDSSDLGAQFKNRFISITLRENQLSVGGPSRAQTCL